MGKVQYVNPFTDFGFKKIFGEEASLPLLKSFLNALLPDEAQIQALQFRNSEFLGQSKNDRKAIYDLYCESESGEKFIVELQKAKQNYFIDRSIYYSTFPIQEQALKGEWDYKLQSVYCIGILDFVFLDYSQDDVQKGRTKHVVKLKDEFNKVVYDKLTYIYLEMPNFGKSLDELESLSDKWLYFLKHLEDLESMPQIFSQGSDVDVFEQAFAKASIATWSSDEQESYERSLKSYRDMYSVVKTAREEGMEKGMKKGMEKGMSNALEQMIKSGIKEQEARKILGLD